MSGPGPVAARKKLVSLLSRYRGRLAAGFALLVLTNLLSLAIPWLLKLAVDALQRGTTARYLVTVALAAAGVALVQAGVRTVSRLAILGMSRRASADLLAELFAHLESLPHPWFQRTPAGEILSRSINDVRQVRMLLGPGVLNGLNTAILYAASLTLLLAIDARLTLYAVLPFPLLLGVVFRLTRRIHDGSQRVQEVLAAISTHLQESLNGIAVVKSYSREDAEIARMAARSTTYLDENARVIRARSVLIPVMGGMGALGTIAVLFFGGREVVSGRLTLGEFAAFSSYLALLVWPTVALGWILGVYQRGMASLERICEVLRVEPEGIPARARPERKRAAAAPDALRRGPASVEIRDLHFSRESGGQSVFRLEGVSLRIEPGSTLGIVGRVGTGKTTLADAIARLTPVPDGTVFLDGTDVNSLDPRALRRRIGFVPQDPFLFSTTIRENIAYGADGPVDADALARRAALDADLADLPAGLDTPLGERGITLSGGQRQRVTLARALAIEPDLLILDDALSSVDAETEERILDGLRAGRGRTTILISHRISAVAHADRIVVLDAGKIAEEGDHASLLARGGIYARLARLQAIESEMERTE